MNYQNSEYWVAYNWELPNGIKAEYLVNSDDLYIIIEEVVYEK